MVNQPKISNNRNYWKKSLSILGFVLLAFSLMFGFVSCRKSEKAGEDENLAQKEGIVKIEGTVKVAFSKYIYIPEASGFDIVLQGDISGGVEGLAGNEVRGEGKFSPEMPAILVADTIEAKNESGQWQNVFTKTGDVDFSELIDMKTRDTAFPTLENLAYDKADDWEGKGKGKLFGKLEKDQERTIIVVFDDKGKQTGSVIVDNIHDFATFYVQKLRLFDQFWFYLAIKETVDWNTRRRTRELFHADILFAGLY